MCEKCHLLSFAGSYHCEICNLCIPAYSHHSDWLNNCIGSANSVAYLGGLAGLGLAAACQATVFIVLLVYLLQDKAAAMRINEKYSVRDQGSFFHLIMYFSLLLSAIIAIINFTNLAKRLWKITSKWCERRTIQRLLFPATSAPLKAIYSSEAPVHRDSLDSHSVDFTGSVTVLPFSPS